MQALHELYDKIGHTKKMGVVYTTDPSPELRKRANRFADRLFKALSDAGVRRVS